MPWVGFEPTIPASEQAKTVHALDHSATVTGHKDWTTQQTEDISIRRREHTVFIYLFFGLWGYWHCGHSWPIVPASGDNDDDCGEADGM
jgi:hypothetical protein